jgi:hypothetical protein
MLRFEAEDAVLDGAGAKAEAESLLSDTEYLLQEDLTRMRRLQEGCTNSTKEDLQLLLAASFGSATAG